MGDPDRSGSRAGRPPTILVVEDEALISLRIAEFLRSRGFLVVEAGDAEHAVDALQNGHAVDLVFADVHVPGKLDGFGLAQWIRRERPEIKVILTSGVTWTVEAAEYMDHVGEFLPKPYELADVEREIRRLLTHQQTAE